MTLYLGNKPVGLCKIVEKEIAKEKFGATVDSFLGDVDADGNYVASSEPFEVNLAGVKSIPNYGFARKFGYCGNITGLLANDVTFVGDEAFSQCIAYISTNAKPIRVEFNNLEEITKPSVFSYFAEGRVSRGVPTFSFSKLKKVSGNSVFYYMYKGSIDVAYTFPALEEISGNQSFYCFCDAEKSNLYFAKVKKITGNTSSQYSSIFGAWYVNGTKWYFPSATEVTGYLWAMSSYTGEIHFAAANQAAIEACEGYDYKWGFAGASLFFDL